MQLQFGVNLQCAYIKFCFSVRKKASERYWNVSERVREKCIQVSKWCVYFKASRNELEYDKKTRRQRVDFCAKLKNFAANNKNFLSIIITCNESWIYGYNSGINEQWKSFESSQSKIQLVKNILIVFLDIKHINEFRVLLGYFEVASWEYPI